MDTLGYDNECPFAILYAIKTLKILQFKNHKKILLANWSLYANIELSYLLRSMLNFAHELEELEIVGNVRAKFTSPVKFPILKRLVIKEQAPMPTYWNNNPHNFYNFLERSTFKILKEVNISAFLDCKEWKAIQELIATLKKFTNLEKLKLFLSVRQTDVLPDLANLLKELRFLEDFNVEFQYLQGKTDTQQVYFQVVARSHPRLSRLEVKTPFMGSPID